MTSSIPEFLANMTLATSPQASFEQADSLLLQTSELRQEAIDLQAQIDALNERADVLHTTATGLQAIAAQDRAIIQSRFNLAVEFHADFSLIYGPDTNNSTRFHQLEPRVKDGLATMEEVENFIDELQSSSVPARSERSIAPEPETPDTSSIVIPSVEGVQTTKTTPSPVAPLHKRKSSSNTVNAGSSKRIKQTPILGPGPSRAGNGNLTTSLYGNKEPEAPTNQSQESSVGTVQASLAVADAEAGPENTGLLFSQESQEQFGRAASVELGSQYISTTSHIHESVSHAGSMGLNSRGLFKETASGSRPGGSLGGNNTFMSQADGSKETSGDGMIVRKRANKSKQRKRLLALANTDVGAESTPRL